MPDMNDLTVAIFLPTYNRRDYLPEAISSVRGQQYQNWRLFVVNDGGESVKSVVDSFNDPRIVYFDRPHLGKAAQMNFLMDQVEDGYIGYMDDDDVMLPNHLSALVAEAERTGAEFLYSDLRRVYSAPDGRVLKQYVPPACDVTYETIRFVNAVGHPQILHTKQLAVRIGGYDERLRILIDYDFIRRLAREVAPVHVREVTYEYRIRLQSEDLADTNSISGLWKSDPAEAGRSVMAIFEKDPAALADLYRAFTKIQGERNWMLNSPYWRMTAPLRFFVRLVKKVLARCR